MTRACWESALSCSTVTLLMPSSFAPPLSWMASIARQASQSAMASPLRVVGPCSRYASITVVPRCSRERGRSTTKHSTNSTHEVDLMKYAETILPEFDREMANTRKVLGRVPEDKLDWQAHPRSH